MAILQNPSCPVGNLATPLGSVSPDESPIHQDLRFAGFGKTVSDRQKRFPQPAVAGPASTVSRIAP